MTPARSAQRPSFAKASEGILRRAKKSANPRERVRAGRSFSVDRAYWEDNCVPRSEAVVANQAGDCIPAPRPN
jgi:hypothetical protein